MDEVYNASQTFNLFKESFVVSGAAAIGHGGSQQGRSAAFVFLHHVASLIMTHGKMDTAVRFLVLLSITDSIGEIVLYRGEA